MATDFEAWLRTTCFQKPTPEAYDLAKEAWKAALEERNAVVEQEWQREAMAVLRELDKSTLAQPDWPRMAQLLKEAARVIEALASPKSDEARDALWQPTAPKEYAPRTAQMRP
jgi:hypothetical protein